MLPRPWTARPAERIDQPTGLPPEGLPHFGDEGQAEDGLNTKPHPLAPVLGSVRVRNPETQ